jgi:hypothetical protein
MMRQASRVMCWAGSVTVGAGTLGPQHRPRLAFGPVRLDAWGTPARIEHLPAADQDEVAELFGRARARRERDQRVRAMPGVPPSWPRQPPIPSMPARPATQWATSACVDPEDDEPAGEAHARPGVSAGRADRTPLCRPITTRGNGALPRPGP